MSETKLEAKQWAHSEKFSLSLRKFAIIAKIEHCKNFAMFAKFSLCLIANFFFFEKKNLINNKNKNKNNFFRDKIFFNKNKKNNNNKKRFFFRDKIKFFLKKIKLKIKIK